MSTRLWGRSLFISKSFDNMFLAKISKYDLNYGSSMGVSDKFESTSDANFGLRFYFKVVAARGSIGTTSVSSDLVLSLLICNSTFSPDSLTSALEIYGDNRAPIMNGRSPETFGFEKRSLVMLR